MYMTAHGRTRPTALRTLTTTHEVPIAQFSLLRLLPEEHSILTFDGDSFPLTKCGYLSRPGRRLFGTSCAPSEKWCYTVQANANSMRSINLFRQDFAVIEHLLFEVNFTLPKGSSATGGIPESKKKL